MLAGPDVHIDAVKTLASGWINDMLAGTHTGVYGAPGQPLDIMTDAGTASATALPAQPTPASPVDAILNTVITFVTETFYNVAATLRYTPL